MILIALLVYSVWTTLNIQQSYFKNNQMTLGNLWNIFFSLLMCYWLVTSSMLFLFAKVIDGLFALLLGVYLHAIPGAPESTENREKIIRNYWGYTLTDLVICFMCFVITLLEAGYLNG